MAIARARLITGNASITVNKIDINALQPREIRELILEPVNVSGITKDIANNSSISITVRGEVRAGRPRRHGAPLRRSS